MSASRSILDAFTIFPFAIVLALALGEAFKKAISEENDQSIAWGTLFALMSFLFLILPFYQGMNRYLLFSYGDQATSKPHPVFLIIDGAAFMFESALFFFMSRNLKIERWTTFYWSVFTLLMADSAWGLTVRLHADGSALEVIKSWTTLNLVAGIAILLLITLGGRIRTASIPAAIGAGLMFCRSVVDYWVSWDFYFR